MEELIRTLPFRVGETLQMSSIRESIQRLFETGRFTDVEVDATLQGDGVRLIFSTEPTFFVSRVNIRGENEPPNRNQLSTAAHLDLGAPFHEDEVAAAIDRMQERLRANGLYKAAIEYRVDTVPYTEEASIYFEVKPGKRAHFGGVAFSGPNGEALSNSALNGLIRSTGWHRGISFVTLPGWRSFTESRYQEGLQNVRRQLQKNDRLLARVTEERREYNAERNRIIPVLSINSGPIIEVRTVGAKVSKTKLRDLIPIYQERTVDRSLLLEGQRNLTTYLQAEGYFNAVVDFTQSEPSPDHSLIEYMIDRGTKHKLKSIAIDGNLYFDRATLRERMFIQPVSRVRYRSGRYSPRLLQQDLDAIRALYQSNGFRDVEVMADVQEDPLHPSEISVHIQVQEGPQWFVNELQIVGLSQEDEAYLRPQLRSTEGQPFSTANVAGDRDSILLYFFNGGYSEASFNWTQTEGSNKSSVNLRFTINPGEVQYVRDILVRGLDTTKPSLVAERILLRPGDPLSLSQIGLSQQRLYDLGIFAKVQTATQNPDGKEESKRVLFYMDEARKYSLNLGVGAEMGYLGRASTTTALASGPQGFTPRVSIGLSRINFLGLGHTVGLQTLVSTQQQRALLNYLAPQFQGNPTLSLTVSALFNNSLDIRTFGSRRWEGSIQLAKRLSKSNTLQVRYTLRHVSVNSLNVAPELIPLLSQPVRVQLIGGTFLRDRRDDPVDSHRGSYNSLDLAIARSVFASPTEVCPPNQPDCLRPAPTYFVRMLFRNSTYHPIKRDLVLARSLQLGYIGRISGFPDVPIAERFFSGGASSHRGFPQNQAGPRDPLTGFPIGGLALFFHSTEFRFPLIGDNLGAVLFHDMGNVFRNFDNLSFRVQQPTLPSGRKDLTNLDYMVHAVGGGIRYRTPVGPLRIDLAYAPNPPEFFGFKGSLEDIDKLKPGEPLCPNPNPALCGVQHTSRFQFHFSLGQTF